MQPIDVLQRYWGYDSFRECQAEIIDSVLAGRDTIGLLPTGGGKSITFQIPALLLEGLTIVITPLISLMKDQVDNLRARGIKAGCLHSGMAHREVKLTLDRIALKKIKIIYLAPEKLARKEFLSEINTWDVSLIVVDESHCISQWGYDFRPSYLNINSLRKLFSEVPIMALTASATPAVVSDIADKLEMRQPATFKRSFARPNISYIVRRCDDKESMLLRILHNTSDTAIVYVRSRRRTAQIAEILNREHISADFYHAGLAPEEKDLRQDRWKNNEVRVMVATNAFGMGIDKPDVRTVVHYDMPSSLEEYYQEAGRAGRDGRESYAAILVTPADKALLKRRLSESFPEREFQLLVYEKLGNFLNIAIGDGYNQVYECDFKSFCRTFNLPARPTAAALSILTRAGCIEYSDDVDSRSRLMITSEKSEFYSLRLDDTTDKVLQTLLRSYTGLFADYVPINEVYLAYISSLTADNVYQALLLLSRMHIVSYIPKRTLPFVYYPTSRDLPKHVVIPRSVYEEQLKRATARMEAMCNYVFDNSNCRVERMLSYFGEPLPQTCGKCDICREAKHVANSQQRKSYIKSTIDVLLQKIPEGITLDILRQAFTRNLDEAIAQLRERVDKGEVLLKNGVFRIR